MDDFFDIETRVSRRVLYIFGLWPPLYTKASFLTYLRLIFVIGCMLGFSNIPQTWKMFDSNFNELLETLTSCNITMLVVVIKALTVWFNRKVLDDLLNIMAENSKNLKTEAEKLIMKKNSKLSRMVSVIMLCTCISASLSRCAMNTRIRIQESQSFSSGRFNASQRIRPLYLLSKFPYDIQATPYYEITWISQCITVIFAATSLAAVDGLVASITLHLCAQLRILNVQLADLLASTVAKKNGSKLDLSKIVEKHNHLIWFADTIEKSFNVQFLAQLLASILIFCLIGYRIVVALTMDVIPVLKIMHAMYYYLSFTGSLFVYCFVAMILDTDSTQLYETAYNGEWYELAPSDAKMLTIIMMRASRPMELTAGKFAPLSMQLYCSVMRTSGGYVSVLLAMQQKNLGD